MIWRELRASARVVGVGGSSVTKRLTWGALEKSRVRRTTAFDCYTSEKVCWPFNQTAKVCGIQTFYWKRASSRARDRASYVLAKRGNAFFIHARESIVGLIVGGARSLCIIFISWSERDATHWTCALWWDKERIRETRRRTWEQAMQWNEP